MIQNPSDPASLNFPKNFGPFKTQAAGDLLHLSETAFCLGRVSFGRKANIQIGENFKLRRWPNS